MTYCKTNNKIYFVQKLEVKNKLWKHPKRERGRRRAITLEETEVAGDGGLERDVGESGHRDGGGGGHGGCRGIGFWALEKGEGE